MRKESCECSALPILMSISSHIHPANFSAIFHYLTTHPPSLKISSLFIPSTTSRSYCTSTEIHHFFPATMSGSSSSASPSKPPENAPTGPKAYRAAQAMTSRSRIRLNPNPNPWHHVPSPSAARHSSSPLVRSPLQQSFPAGADTTKSAPNTPETMNAKGQETPSRRSRFTEPDTRPRGESRSSSVPIIRTPHDSMEEKKDEEGRTLDPYGGSASRAASPMSLPGDSNNYNNNYNRRSVKHLTCFWWWEKKQCKYSDDECRE